MKLLKTCFGIALLGCLALAAPSAVVAATIQGGGGAAVIDIAPLVTVAVKFAFAIVMGLVAKFVDDEGARRYLNKILELSVQYAIETVVDLDWAKLSSRNELVALAANYVIRSAPRALNKFGITRDRLEDMVLARIFPHDPKKGLWKDDDKAGHVDELELARRRGRGQGDLEAGAVGRPIASLSEGK
jgi:hypothetical protein